MRDTRSRLGHAAARLLGGLPASAQVALSGRSPVVLDGQTLDPGLRLLLLSVERSNAVPMHTLGPVEARRDFARQVGITNGPKEEVGRVRELVVAGAHGGLAARLYSPGEPSAEPDAPRPLIVYYHGGGFVLGDLDTHDVPCRLLCRHSGANVLSVDYGLAPEHPFPEPLEDAYASLTWAMDHAARLGADPGRVAVGGDSAGAALAAVTSARIAAEGARPIPALQLLLYPVTDVSGGTESREVFSRGYVLDRELLDWFEGHYAPDGGASDPRLSAVHTDPSTLAKVPPTLVVTAGFDPLRDEGEQFARLLGDAGVPTVTRRFPGLIHGFANFVGVNRPSRDAVVETAGMTRAMLANATKDWKHG